MNCILHPEALEEYREAARYYAEQQPGVERRFTESVEQALFQIRDAPMRYAILENDVRQCRTRVFPYTVLYIVDANGIFVVAIMHKHRKPGYWRNRLKRK